MGKIYLDKKAATAVKATTSKPALTKSPFIREFKYGSSGEGYWTYQHMVLQLEDCVDVLKAIFPMYAFLFLFNHLCGHDKQREDGLNVEKMTRSYGGAQPHLRDTTIKQQQGYLGPFIRILEPGDMQSMVFKASDIGPFWMTEQDQEAKCHDRVIEGETVR